MKVLFLTPRLPYPPAGGDKVTVYSHIRLLSPLVDSIHVLSLIEDPAEVQCAREFEAEFPNLTVHTVRLSRNRSRLNAALGLAASSLPLQVHYYRSSVYARRASELAREIAFDACYVHLVRMAPYARNLPIPVKVLCMTDCLTLRYERSAPYATGMGRHIERIERKRITPFELQCTEEFNASIVVTEIDRRRLRELGAQGPLALVPFGVDLSRFTLDTAEARDPDCVAFLGNLHSAPNRDAVRYFVEQIWPRIRQHKPGARFQIIGINAPDWVRRLHGNSGVEVAGAVDDVRPYLRRAACTVCPMRIGAGIQTKNLESLALKTPVVSTRIGFEGLDAPEGHGVVVADSPQEFAEHVLGFLSDAAERERQGEAGRKIIENQYDWNTRAPVLYALLRGEVPREE
ncbi:MAG TPA: glycosyltransferase [Candidatus Hydrogenedentes bacterium]|nr:glycosyltransferase [Candidatus Hydrogenedentota bacterium]HPK00687.1 glycosyltransferase [Candidatus Hydrogenedentota bacterium]